jgi:hypothetical protein
MADIAVGLLTFIIKKSINALLRQIIKTSGDNNYDMEEANAKYFEDKRRKLAELQKDLDAVKKIEESIAKPKGVFTALEEEEAINGRNANQYIELLGKKLQHSKEGNKNFTKLQELMNKYSKNNSNKFTKLQELMNKYSKKTGGSRKTSYCRKPKRATRKSKIDL